MYQKKSNQKEAGAITFSPDLFISGCARSSECCIGFLQVQSTGSRASGLGNCSVQALRLWCVCGLQSTQAQLLCGMWDLSSPTRDQTFTTALEGGFLTTGPPGKSPSAIILRSENIDVKAKFFLVTGRTTSIKS